MLNKDALITLSMFAVIIGLTVFQVLVFTKVSLSMGSNKRPTAIVVDAETGKPIKGAVAIAIWRKHSIKDAAWFEGGLMVPVRIEEVVSDKEGKIYIDDFWDWHFLENEYPRLTIYKPGYVCWDQKVIYINKFKSEKREDFNKKNRIVRMKKWPKEFSFNGHRGFVDNCTGYGDIHEAPKKLFLKTFDCETPYRIKEDQIRYKEKKKMIKTKRERQK